ncbi:MAG: ABC transporter ATP-binding protein/permease [Actinomyces sp.]|jgi:ATP-binding cassette subfamily B protein|nr:ABC transporter ATP-binding protein [Actinomyces sp.]MCI1831319.1 ABC transporter ATP-binding protein/permease [Actinomyces sp.]
MTPSSRSKPTGPQAQPAPPSSESPDSARTQEEGATPQTREQERQVTRRSWDLLRSLLHPVRLAFLGLAVMVVLAQLTGVVGPWLIAWAIDHALPALLGGDGLPATLVAGAYLAAGLATGLLTLGFERQSSVLGQRMLVDLRRRVFRHTQRLDLEFHQRYTSGRLVARQTNDMETLRELLEGGVQVIVGSTLTMALTAISIVSLDGPTALVMVAMLVPCLALTVWFQRRSKVAYRKIRTHSARLIVKFTETFTGIRAVQAFRAEDRQESGYTAIAGDYRDATQDSVMISGVYQSGFRLLGNLTVALVLLVGGLRVAHGALSVGVLLALVLYARRFFQPVDQIAAFYNTWQSSTAAMEKIAQLLAEAPAVADPARPVALGKSGGRLDFEDVAFRYSGDGPEVLHPVSLHIPAGQTVALVGRTGAGKSTIAKLVARFYDVTRGSVRLDGVDVRSLSSRDLHRAVVMVTQEAFLFGGTVRDNIALGRPDATDAEIRAAAEAVGADEFIRAMPYGYNTDVNKRGGRVSAGQRQLISFARAFLADPEVLILDEATSSLDLPSERQVQDGLTSLLAARPGGGAGRTALIIAHRLSTVMIADRVLVVDDGRIVEDGSPSDLIAHGGQFASLYRAWQDTLH